MIKSTTKKKVKKASSKKANPGKDWVRHADLRPKGGSLDRSSSKDSDKIISNQEYYAKLHKLAEDIQWEKRNDYPIHGYPWQRALEDASEILAKKQNPSKKKCRVIRVRRKISMGAGKRPRILQVRRKVCNPSKKVETELNDLIDYDVFLWITDSRKAKSKKLLLAGILEEVPSWDESKHYSVYNEYSGNEPYVFDIEDIISIVDDNILIQSI
jgi:hypothetical protein